MMKTLFLARHAKSSWDDQLFSDFFRPLKSSGVLDACLMGSHLKSKNIVPALIISSPASRAVNTAIAFAGETGYPFQEILLDQGLYESSAEELLQAVARHGTHQESIMLVGHDPSLSNLFMKLTGIGIEKIPTAAVAAISLHISNWQEISGAGGKLLFLEKPKEIKAIVK